MGAAQDKFSQLLTCKRGNFAMITAILAPALLASAGLAVDYVNLASAKAEIAELCRRCGHRRVTQGRC